MDERYHIPVLLKEVITFLEVKTGNKYIDATLGGGGYTKRILELGGNLLAIDVDQDAIDYVSQKFKVQSSKFKVGENVRLVRGNFKDIDEIAHSHNFIPVSGIVFDLGVSSHQLDTGIRGFSFRRDATLDMRMNQDLTVKAQDLVNGLSEKELSDLFWKLGEEENSRRIAKEIVKSRKQKPIVTTIELSDLIKRVVHRARDEKDPSTKVFQALRIAVNDELNSISEALEKSFSLLENGGRIVVVTFHSLEDRIVKDKFRQFEQEHKGTILTHEPIRPSNQEVLENNRSRSAKLRVFEKHHE